MQNLTEEKIIKKAIEIDSQKITGIFFLIKDEKIVFVGRTIIGVGAISQHFKDKDFDKYYFMKCPKEDVESLAYEYIIKFVPIYNKSLPKREGYISLPAYKRKIAELGVEKYTHITKKNIFKNHVGVQLCPYIGSQTYELEGLNRITNLNIKL